MSIKPRRGGVGGLIEPVLATWEGVGGAGEDEEVLGDAELGHAGAELRFSSLSKQEKEKSDAR